MILEQARTSERIVVTLDADFHALLAVQGAATPSVIRIRREGLSANDVADLLGHLPRDHEPALRSGVALSVRVHLVGIRKLPLNEDLSETDNSEIDE